MCSGKFGWKSSGPPPRNGTHVLCNMLALQIGSITNLEVVVISVCWKSRCWFYFLCYCLYGGYVHPVALAKTNVFTGTSRNPITKWAEILLQIIIWDKHGSSLGRIETATNELKSKIDRRILIDFKELCVSNTLLGKGLYFLTYTTL